MTFRWRICSSAAFCLALAWPLAAAAVNGRVELRDSRDPAVRKKRDYSGVVIWLDPVDRSASPPPPGRTARMVQKDKTFTPHVLAIPVGTTVDFPNFDPIFHNAFSNYNGQIFDVGLYPPGTSRTVRFSRPGVVRVFCNIHATMSAVIVVLNSPYYTVTAADGNFTVANVPRGDYYLRVFHERTTAAPLERRISVGAEPLTIPPIAISENGYLSIPHKNKYGRDYPSAPDEGGLYPGARK